MWSAADPDAGLESGFIYVIFLGELLADPVNDHESHRRTPDDDRSGTAAFGSKVASKTGSA